MKRFVLGLYASAAMGLCLPAPAQTNDFADVTLQPWSVVSVPLEGLPARWLTSTNGLVVVYSRYQQNEPNLSTNFGQTWSQLRLGIGGPTNAYLTSTRVYDYLYESSTAWAGNGFLRATWVTNGNLASFQRGLIDLNGKRLTGYLNMAFGGGLLVAIEKYSTYVSADSGTNWLPYLNPWTPEQGSLVSFNRIFHDGTSFVAAAQTGLNAFEGSTWRSLDGVNWRRILSSNAVTMDNEGRLVVAQNGKIYDLVGDSLVAAHLEFPNAQEKTDYHRVGSKIYYALGALLYYSNDGGVTRYRTGFPAEIGAVWSMPATNGQHVVRVLLTDKRMFTSAPVTTPGVNSAPVRISAIELRPMLAFEAEPGVTVIIEESTSSEGPWVECARIASTGGNQTWNDNRSMAGKLFYRARKL